MLSFLLLLLSLWLSRILFFFISKRVVGEGFKETIQQNEKSQPSPRLQLRVAICVLWKRWTERGERKKVQREMSKDAKRSTNSWNEGLEKEVLLRSCLGSSSSLCELRRTSYNRKHTLQVPCLRIQSTESQLGCRVPCFVLFFQI